MKNWCLEVWGDYACFTRPEMKVERVSYDVITPSSARSIYDAILWKPAIKWHITNIEVMNPIEWISVRRNEVGPVASRDKREIFIDGEGIRQQRAGLFLRNVRYRIYGYFEFIPPEKRSIRKNPPPAIWADAYEQEKYGEPEKTAKDRNDENAAKYAAMFERRAKKGQCFNQPYFGCREFACYFKLIEHDDETPPEKLNQDLGFMLYDMKFDPPDENGVFSGNANPEFFRAKLDNGVIICDRNRIEVYS
jgi:CRISPR-associated protein Cas5d